MSGMARMTGIKHNEETSFVASNSVNTDAPKKKRVRPSKAKAKKSASKE